MLDLLQQISEIEVINFVIILAKMTNFWNISSTPAPIHITGTSMKDTHPPIVTLWTQSRKDQCCDEHFLQEPWSKYNYPLNKTK